MSIHFREIDKSNYMECISLSVLDQQKDFVASNQFSLLQAAYEENIFTLAIYFDETMVGFLLYDFDEELQGWSMSRFMIDHRYQNRGYGRKALEAFLYYFREKHGKQLLYTSAEVDNHVAIALYESFEFIKGEVFTYEFNGKSYTEVRMKKNM